MKTEQEDLHLESDSTNISEPGLDQAIALLAYFYWEARARSPRRTRIIVFGISFWFMAPGRMAPGGKESPTFWPRMVTTSASIQEHGVGSRSMRSPHPKIHETGQTHLLSSTGLADRRSNLCSPRSKLHGSIICSL